jgi:hypothetical protein
VTPRGLRTLLVVDAQSRPLMRYLCTLLTPQQRADLLFLAHVADLKACKPALQSSLRSLLDKFKAVADSK